MLILKGQQATNLLIESNSFNLTFLFFNYINTDFSRVLKGKNYE